MSDPIYAAAVKMWKAVRSLERAQSEFRRASSLGEQPRLQKAGNRQFSAMQRLSAAAREFERAPQTRRGCG